MALAPKVSPYGAGTRVATLTKGLGPILNWTTL